MPNDEKELKMREALERKRQAQMEESERIATEMAKNRIYNELDENDNSSEQVVEIWKKQMSKERMRKVQTK